MAGRKPKPTNILRLEGNPGKRPLNDKEPQPKVAIPDCPEFMFPEAKKEWKRIILQLKILGLISEIDSAALMGYCQSYAMAQKAAEAIKLSGLTCVTDKGNVIQNPEVGVFNTALSNMHKFLVEFGMTPSSRSRIKVDTNDKKQKSQMESVLNNAV